MIAIRVLMGISQGPMFPACLALLSSWVPLKERSTIVSLTYGGIMVFYDFLYCEEIHDSIHKGTKVKRNFYIL